MSQTLVEWQKSPTPTTVIEQEWQKLNASGKLHMMCYASVSFRKWTYAPWCWEMAKFVREDYSESRYEYTRNIVYLPKETPGLELWEKELDIPYKKDFTPLGTRPHSFFGIRSDFFYFYDWQIRRLYKFCERMDQFFSNMQIDIYYGYSEWTGTFLRHGIDVNRYSDPADFPCELQLELSLLVGIPVLCFGSIFPDKSTNTISGYMAGHHLSLIPAYRFVLQQWPFDLDKQREAVNDLQKMATDFVYSNENFCVGKSDAKSKPL